MNSAKLLLIIIFVALCISVYAEFRKFSKYERIPQNDTMFPLISQVNQSLALVDTNATPYRGRR